MNVLKTLTVFIIVFSFCINIRTANAAGSLRIGFVTDWEYGKQKKQGHKLPKKANSFLKSVVKYYNSNYNPDIVVGGGDYISGYGEKKKSVKSRLKKINKSFKKLKAQRLYCIGNHDVGKLTEGEVKKALGIKYTHSVTDKNGIRIITLDTNTSYKNKVDKATGTIADEELSWLEQQLQTNLPVIIFSHHSPAQTPDGNGMRTNLTNGAQVRSVLETSGNVVAVFSGHHAINYQTEVNGINYFIINNLSDVDATGSFATIDVSADENETTLAVKQFGNMPAEYSITKEN